MTHLILTGYVVCFVLSAKKGYVLLLKKKRPPVHQGRLNGLGGKIDISNEESPLACLRREVYEEGRITLQNYTLLNLTVAHNGQPLWVYASCYRGIMADVTKGDAGQAKWYSVANLPHNRLVGDVANYVKQAVSETYTRF